MNLDPKPLDGRRALIRCATVLFASAWGAALAVTSAEINGKRNSTVIDNSFVASNLTRNTTGLIMDRKFTRGGSHIGTIGFHRPGDPSVAAEVESAIVEAQRAKRPLRAVMLERLGPSVRHQTPRLAMATLEELEEMARLWPLSGRSAPLLDEARLAKLRKAFDVRQ